MSSFSFPKDYQSGLNLYDTQVAIKMVKDFFQTLLAERLNLLRALHAVQIVVQAGLWVHHERRGHPQKVQSFRQTLLAERLNLLREIGRAHV